MIDLEISGVHFELNEKVKQYASKKISVMDKYMPKNERSGTHGKIVLSEEEGQSKNRYICEVIIHTPHETFTAKESTVSIYAAIDIVEEKIKAQILKHKDKKQNNRQRRRTQRMLKQFRFRKPSGGEEE